MVFGWLHLEGSGQVDPELGHVEDTVVIAVEDFFVEGAGARYEPLHATRGDRSSHISRTIDGAEEAGLVERGVDPDDRRASQVMLTTAGRAVLEDFAPRLRAIIDRVIGQTLSSAEVDTLVELLGRIEGASGDPCIEDEDP